MSYKNGLSNKEISEALRLLSDTDLVKNYLVKKSISLAADRIDFNDSLIAELEQQLAKNGEVNRWTPVSERLPDEICLKEYVIIEDLNAVRLCYFNNSSGFFQIDYLGTITYPKAKFWKPITAPQEGE